MKTEDLIKAIAVDAKSAEPPIAQTLAIAVCVGTLIAALALFGTVGIRHHFLELMTSSPRFIFKFVPTLAVAIPAFVLVRELARPEFKPGKALWWLALAPVLLAVGVIFELVSLPSDAWRANMVGHNSMFCLVVIPLLSLAPLVAVLYALRQGAPTHPAIAGAVGGLLSAGIGATLYAAHCPDDSPLFLMAWYTAGIFLVTCVGALLGSRILRW
jgi:hypothetical protein